MDDQTSETADIDNNYLRSRPNFAVGGEHGHVQVSVWSSVTIRLDKHTPVSVLQPQLQMELTSYTWFDENNSLVLHHSFRDSLERHYPWRDDETQTPWTVDFDISEVTASKIRCSNGRHPLHDKYMLSYSFENPIDYQRFQTMFRRKSFIRDYAITSIDCDRKDTLMKKEQCIKSWQSNEGISLTIPVSLKSSGSSPLWKIKHIEITASWMKWESIKTNAIKARYRKAHEASSSQVPTPFRRRSSLFYDRLKQRSPPAPTIDEDTIADPSLARQWPSFLIKFISSEGGFISLFAIAELD
jgi:hypothetical protein